MRCLSLNHKGHEGHEDGWRSCRLHSFRSTGHRRWLTGQPVTFVIFVFFVAKDFVNFVVEDVVVSQAA